MAATPKAEEAAMTRTSSRSPSIKPRRALQGPPLQEAILMKTDYMKRGDDVFLTIMDEGLVIETYLPAMTDEWAFYRRVYRIERYGRSWWRGTA